MVFVRLKIGNKSVDVDPLALISKNEFWRAFFEFANSSELYQIIPYTRLSQLEYPYKYIDYDMSEIRQYILEDEYGYGDTMVYFIDKLDRLRSNTMYKTSGNMFRSQTAYYPDINEKFDQYYNLCLRFGGYMEHFILYDHVFTLFKSLPSNTPVEERNQYTQILFSLKESMDVILCDILIPYNVYYDKIFEDFFDKIIINGKQYKAWLHAMYHNKSGALYENDSGQRFENKLDYTKDLIINSPSVINYLDKSLRLMTLYTSTYEQISCLSSIREELNKLPLKELYYIRACFLLLEGLDNNMDLTLFNKLDLKSGYKVANDGSLNIIGVNNIEDDRFKFIFTNINTLEKGYLPLRSKTGLSRKQYNDKVRDMLKNMDRTDDIKQIARNHGYTFHDGMIEIFEQKDWDDIISRKINTLIIGGKQAILLDIHNIKNIGKTIQGDDNIVLEVKDENRIIPLELVKYRFNDSGFIFKAFIKESEGSIISLNVNDLE